MLFSSGAASAEPLGLRRDRERREGDRRSYPRSSADRRQRDRRRRSSLRSLLFAAVVVAVPKAVKPEPFASHRWLQPAVATVTTSIDSVIGLPAPHAYDDLIAEASRRY